MTHRVKCWPESFAELKKGSKTFEIRQNDRGYRVKDLLILQEFVPDEIAGHPTGKFTGNQEARFITSITTSRDGLFGLAPGWCVMSLREV